MLRSITRRLRLPILAGVGLSLLVVVTRTHAEPARANPLTSPFANSQWTLTDIAGKSHQPWADPETKAVVVVFVGTNCPFPTTFNQRCAACSSSSLSNTSRGISFTPTPE